MRKRIARTTQRDWQKKARDIVVSSAKNGLDRALISACPGAGKTFAALLIAQALFRLFTSLSRPTRYLIVLTPNLGIKSQWVLTARTSFDLDLQEVTSQSMLNQGTLPGGLVCLVMNYQQAINYKRSLRTFCDQHHPILVLDEVHHTAGAAADRDGNAWGHTVEHAFENAGFKLCMTGTPFREGNNPIAFVDYNDDREAVAAFSYPYRDAIADGICRPLMFRLWNVDLSWWSRSTGQRVRADFNEKLSQRLSRERLEAAVSVASGCPADMLSAAHAKLLEIRERGGVDSLAAGLVVAKDIKSAHEIAEVLEAISDEKPLLIHSKIDDAQDLIDEFRDGDRMWCVAVSMLSEGVDIKRLRVGVYATNIRAPLYFRQFCGRFVRVQESRAERSYVFLPRDPVIEEIAREIEKERVHALGEEETEDESVRGSGGGHRGPRGPLHVVGGKSEHSGDVVHGQYFDSAFIEQYRDKLSHVRLSHAGIRHLDDAEILSLLIAWGTIEPPRGSAAE